MSGQRSIRLRCEGGVPQRQYCRDLWAVPDLPRSILCLQANDGLQFQNSVKNQAFARDRPDSQHRARCGKILLTFVGWLLCRGLYEIHKGDRIPWTAETSIRHGSACPVDRERKVYLLANTL